MSPDHIVSRARDNWGEDDNASETINIEKLAAMARRQWRVVAVSVIVFAIIGILYIATAVPLYTSAASILIDRGSGGIVNRLSMDDVPTEDDASVLSQVELLKSDTIGLSVVDKLKLSDDPLFMASNSSVIGSITATLKSILNFSSWFSAADVTLDEAEIKRRLALANVKDNMEIERVGRSYVLTISFTSPSSEMSSRIAGAIADAYIVDKLDSKFDATRRASTWLQERIEELRQKSLETDLAVQKFRTQNGLMATGGQLITDQQLSELNSALIVAQADTAKTKAKYERIKSIVDSGQSDAIVTDVLDSSISNDLRGKFLAASKLEADIADRLGPNHIRAVRLRAEMKEYQRLMFEELGRIAESYRSEYDVAQAREKSLVESVSKAQGASAMAGETQVQLRELERSAETYKNLYQTFLQRYQEAIQQQSFPITEARVITRPVKPQNPSYPRKPLVLALAMFLGAALGCGLGAIREFRDRFFRTGEQVREELDLEFLGLAPLLKGEATISSASEDAKHPRELRRVNSISNYVVDHPMSAFAETLRSAKIAIDLGVKERRTKVIGIVSTLPGEGKSTIAVNFAELLAMQGARTILIDCDMRNPGSTRAIGRHAEAGLLEAILENQPMKDLLLIDPKTKLAFLPAVVKRRIPHSSELLSSDAMNTILETARANFDYVVLDLPPLAPVVDARAISSKVDGFLFIVEWGRTSRRVVRSTLWSDPEVANKCVGAILNKVDAEKMKLYRAYGSSEYYYSRYSSYYRED